MVSDYWSSYYQRREAPILPSQFAAFVMNELLTKELPEVESIVDIGCGNGRDRFFFLQLDLPVCAVDMSDAAIANCRERLARRPAAEQKLGRFIVGSAADADVWAQLSGTTSGPVLIYARFFFHAIDDEAEARVLDAAADLIRERGGAICVEARDHFDAASEKVTPAHYRRFIRSDEFAAGLAKRGLGIRYRAEGLGMAKYRNDDAHVFRVIAAA
jgi:SAM-dependent methyltransferase